jgi:hypothetical protein|tara:strand:+ start:2474 stop:2923 length:450 start_codon:yes stop_codon:yes gene_type:complete
MKKPLSIIVVSLLLNWNAYSEEKQLIFLDCKHDYATSLKNPTPEDIVGQFSFTINKDEEIKTSSGSMGLTATTSKDDVIFEGTSTTNKYSFQRVATRGTMLMMEEVSIDRVNGQMINETQMFKKGNTNYKNPDAVVKFYINCKVAKTKF